VWLEKRLREVLTLSCGRSKEEVMGPIWRQVVNIVVQIVGMFSIASWCVSIGIHYLGSSKEGRLVVVLLSIPWVLLWCYLLEGVRRVPYGAAWKYKWHLPGVIGAGGMFFVWWSEAGRLAPSPVSQLFELYWIALMLLVFWGCERNRVC
jgi:hypothetical protein